MRFQLYPARCSARTVSGRGFFFFLSLFPRFSGAEENVADFRSAIRLRLFQFVITGFEERVRSSVLEIRVDVCRCVNHSLIYELLEDEGKDSTASRVTVEGTLWFRILSLQSEDLIQGSVVGGGRIGSNRSAATRYRLARETSSSRPHTFLFCSTSLRVRPPIRYGIHIRNTGWLV